MIGSREGTIESDNRQLGVLADRIALGRLLPPGSELHRLSEELGGIPSLPDRFNTAFIAHGWVFVEFACGYEPAERALKMLEEGLGRDEIDNFLAEHLLGFAPIKWQALKLLGGGMVDPRHPIRAEVTQRVLDAYEEGDYLIAIPLILMLVDGFGVTATGTKSMFAELDTLDELFQSSESVAGHPSALKALLVHLRRGQRGYSETPLSMPLRNGILHGTRLNYANKVVAAKALNLLAAVVEWARDVAPSPKDDQARRDWNTRFLRSNLQKLAPDSPERALALFTAALANHRATDLVALIDYHPTITLLSEKIVEWRELEGIEIAIEYLSDWEVFGSPSDREQNARCQIRLRVKAPDKPESITERMLFATRSALLAEASLPSVWQIGPDILGAIRHLLINLKRG